MALKALLDRFTGADIAAEIQDQLNEYAKPDEERRDRYALYERYYDGDFRSKLSKRQKAYLETNGLSYGEGYCDKVADARTNRMSIEAISGGSESLDKFFEDWAQADGFDETQVTVHDAVEVKGDAYIAVEYDDEAERPIAYFNDPALCKSYYDKKGELELVVKVWPSRVATPTNTEGILIRRMNLHFRDRIEKWYSIGENDDATWMQHLDVGETDADWPIWWTDTGEQDGEPLGVNILHFRRLPRGNKTYGVSALKKAVPIQDAFQKKLLDEFQILDNLAYPQRWATGVNTKGSLGVRVGQWIKSSQKEARFGQLDGADPKQLTDNMEASLRRFATSTSTPLQEMVVSGTISGESRRMIGTGLTDEIQRTQKYLNRPWRDTALMVLKMAQTFGTQKFEGEPTVTIQWGEHEDRSDEEMLDTLVTEVRELGLSRKTALTKRGYDAEAELKASQEEKTEAAAKFLEGMDGGNGANDVVDQGESP